MEYKKAVPISIFGLPDDSYFYKGLSELIVDIDELIYLSLEKIRKILCFYQSQYGFIKRIYQARQRMAIRGKGETVVLIAARKSEALANYWYYNSDIRGWYMLV